MSGTWRLRAAILTLLGALAVHHGRYAFASPEHEHHLAGAHAYLTWLAPVAAVLTFLAIVHLAARLGRADGAQPALPRGRALWLSASGSLLMVFGAQESLETLLTHGHCPQLAELPPPAAGPPSPSRWRPAARSRSLLRGAARVVRWALARTQRRDAHAARTVLPRARPSWPRRGRSWHGASPDAGRPRSV